jgi:hypothetical protein
MKKQILAICLAAASFGALATETTNTEATTSFPTGQDMVSSTVSTALTHELWSEYKPTVEFLNKVNDLIGEFANDVHFFYGPYNMIALNITSASGQSIAAFVDKDANFFMAGPMIDLETKQPYHEKVIDLVKPVKTDFSAQLEGLPYAAEGNGDQIINIVVDPNCHYCHDTWGEMKKLAQKYPDTLQVRYYPVGFLGQDSQDKANRLMGIPAEQRNEAFEGLMADKYHNLGKYEFADASEKQTELVDFMRKNKFGGVPLVLVEVEGIEQVVPGSPRPAIYEQLNTVLSGLTKTQGQSKSE